MINIIMEASYKIGGKLIPVLRENFGLLLEIGEEKEVVFLDYTFIIRRCDHKVLHFHTIDSDGLQVSGMLIRGVIEATRCFSTPLDEHLEIILGE